MKITWILFILAGGYASLSQAQSVDSSAMRTIDSLLRVSKDQRQAGKYDKSIDLASVAQKLALEKLGKNNSHYARTLSSIGSSQEAKGNYNDAGPLYKESLAILEKIISKEDSNYYKILNNYGIVNSKMGKYQQADTILMEVKDIKAKVLGKHRSYASTLNNLSVACWYLEQYDRAKAYCIEALEIQKKEIGDEHPIYLASLTSLAMIYTSIGQLEEAELIFLQVKNIKQHLIEKDSASYAGTLNNLGVLYKEMAHYGKAEYYFLEAKKIKEKTIGKEHPSYATALSVLAEVYTLMGKYNESAQLQIQAQEIRKIKLGDKHPSYLTGLIDLGYLFTEMKNYAEAEQYYLQAKAIVEHRKEEQTDKYIYVLSGLSYIYMLTKQYQAAEAFYLREQAIFEHKKDTNSRNYITFLYRFGTLYKNMQQYDLAGPMLKKAIRLWGENIGKTNRGYGTMLDGYTTFLESTQRWDEAVPYIKEANLIYQATIVSATAYFSEEELFIYMQIFTNRLHGYCSYAFEHRNNELNVVLFSNALFYKGFVLENAAQLARFAHQADDSTQQILNRWKGLNRRLSKEQEKPLKARNDVTQLQAEANLLEKEMIRCTASFSKARQQVAWQDVREQLRSDEAAVEFIHFKYNLLGKSDSTLYAALMLRKNDSFPKLVFLFEEKQLDTLLHQKTIDSEQYVGLIYRNPKLYQLIWAPLDSLLNGVKRIYYSPSGLLHRVSLPALARHANGPLLADRYDLQYVSSTRELVVGKEKLYGKDIQTGLIYGGIQYETDSLKMADARTKLDAYFKNWSPDTIALRKIKATYADTILQRRTWALDRSGDGRADPRYLPGSLQEMEKTERLFQSKSILTMTLREYEASEESFKRLGEVFPSPDVIHVSTHGFFFPDPVRKMEDADQPLPFAENPFFRSGLHFAGSLQAWRKNPPLRGFDNGILYAYEISHLNLSNTKLVVLSACETGLGDIQGSEGVYGLQRAFRLAGAQHVLMSLWKISDKETVDFMDTFYRNWFSGKGTDIREAFARTQKEMRVKYKDPYLWAAFVLI